MRGVSSRAKWADKYYYILALGAIIILGLFLRIYDLGGESIWLDEAASIYESTLSLKEISIHSNQPPLYFVILNGWIHLWGSGEVAIRSLSVIFGILSVLMVYLVGKLLFNTKVGLISSTIAAISQFYIYHSQDARAYSLLLLLSLVSYLFFILILKKDKLWHYPAYFIATALLGFTHIYGFFIVASQILYFFICWKEYKSQRVKLLSTFAGILIILSPVLILLGPKGMSIAERGFWIPRPSLSTLGDTFLEYASGFRISELTPDTINSTLSAIVKYILLLLFVVLSLFSLFFLMGENNKRASSKSRKKAKNVQYEDEDGSWRELVLLCIWLFLPVLIPFIASQVITPIYLSRYTIVASPAFYLLTARGVTIFGKKMVVFTVILIIVLTSFGLYNYYSVDIKAQWREVADLIETESKEGDVIVFCESYVQEPFDYYYKGELPEFGVYESDDTEYITTVIKSAIDEQERLWLVISNVSDLPAVHDYMENRYDLIEWWGYRSIVVFLFNVAD